VSTTANIFADVPRSLVAALDFMAVSAPSDMLPPLGMLTVVTSGAVRRNAPDAPRGGGRAANGRAPVSAPDRDRWRHWARPHTW
jgi:hypothetical protein